MTPIVQTIVLALSDIRSWTWRAVLALLLIVVAYVVPRLTSTTLGLQDILDVGNLVGAGLLTIEMARARQQTPPGPTPTSERGQAGVGLLASLVVLALVPLLLSTSAGCGLLGPVQVEAEREITWQRRPGPTCYVRTLADGEVATETTAPTSCVPPPEFCTPGPGEPGYVTPVSGAAP